MSGRSSLILAVILTLLPWPAAAQGVCVDCVGPERSYSCTIKNADKVQPFRHGQRAQEFVCISELARTGGHQTCRINTSYAGPCMGQPFELDLAKIGSDSVVAPGAPAPGQEGKGQIAAPAKKGPPQTLEELARETMTKSKEQISAADEGVKNAGNAVGGAVKKTWDCMTSLFQKC